MQNMKRAIFLFTIVAAFTMAAIGQDAAKAVVQAAPKVEGINFSLPDTSGKVQTLDDLKGAKGSVIIFLSAQCPVVRDYNDRINQIAADYAAKGVNFIGINSNATEKLDVVKAHADLTYKFPLLIDKGNVFADKLGAGVTPEIFYYDAKNVLIYHGAIDNNRAGTNITTHYLRSAFDLSLAGKPVERASANAFGCEIKRVGAQ